MPYLKEIVCLINENFTRFEKGEKEAIAYQVTRKKDNGEQLYPATFAGNEPKYIGTDDAKSSIIYHRVLRSVYARDTSKFQDRFKRTVLMQMVVYGKGLNMRPEEVESLVIGQFPDNYQNEALTGFTGVNSIIITYTGSDLNPVTVFAGEYKNVPYRIAPEDVYFSVQYTIDILFDKSCLDNCEPANIPHGLCDWIEISTAQEIVDCLNEAQTTEVQEIICASGVPATVHNSDDSYSTQVACGGDLELDDITFNVNLDGVLVATSTVPAMVNNTINIVWS